MNVHKLIWPWYITLPIYGKCSICRLAWSSCPQFSFHYLSTSGKYNTTPFNTTQYKTMQCNAMQYMPLTNRARGPYRNLRPEFFPLWFMAQARSAWAINRRGKNKDPYLTVRTEKTRLVRYLLFLCCVSDGFGNDFYSWGTASNFWSRSKARRVYLNSFLVVSTL